METGHIRPIFIMIVDISGYTRFIQYHKISLLHAEKIIAELMESILKEVEVPVIAHEILGDAITFYAVDEGTPDQGDRIYHQLNRYFIAFREREANLISECSLCRCDACKTVGKLRLKAILHVGKAAFTQVAGIQKISGEDVIISHRLLKNNVQSREYILMTQDFIDRSLYLDESAFQSHIESYGDIGQLKLWVHNMDREDLPMGKQTTWEKWKGFLAIEGYTIKRFFKRNPIPYLNLPQ